MMATEQSCTHQGVNVGAEDASTPHSAIPQNDRFKEAHHLASIIPKSNYLQSCLVFDHRTSKSIGRCVTDPNAEQDTVRSPRLEAFLGGDIVFVDLIIAALDI